MGDCNAGRQERSSGRMVLEREWAALAARRGGQRRSCVWILRGGKAKSIGGGCMQRMYKAMCQVRD